MSLTRLGIVKVITLSNVDILSARLVSGPIFGFFYPVAGVSPVGLRAIETVANTLIKKPRSDLGTLNRGYNQDNHTFLVLIEAISLTDSPWPLK